MRDFLIQVLAIAAGLLIALWIDGRLEAGREQALVDEAYTALGAEIADNLTDLEETRPALDRHAADLRQGIQLIEDLLEDGSTDIQGLQFPLELPSLNAAAWQTADRTGALGYMDYTDVKTFSEIYELQDFVVDSQRQLTAGLADLGLLMVVLESGDPSSLSRTDLETSRQHLYESLVAVNVQRSLATQLAEDYRQAPTH